MACGLLLLSFFSLSFGSSWISPFAIIKALFQQESAVLSIILQYRLPRVFIAIFAGGLFAVAGMLLQMALNNDLASPDVIGLNKCSALLIVILNFFILYPSKLSLILAALSGALIGAFILFHISRRFHFSPQTIILTGVALSFLFDALIKLLTFSQKDLLAKQMAWLVGTLWGRYWEVIPILIISTILFFGFIYFAKASLFLLQLDPSIIPTLGKKSSTLTWTYILISSLITGVAVSSVGAIGFIGLLAPHIIRRFIPTYTSLRFVFAFLVGSIILLLADLIGRSIITPTEIPAGIIVALVGGPYFLFILLIRKSGNHL